MGKALEDDDILEFEEMGREKQVDRILLRVTKKNMLMLLNDVIPKVQVVDSSYRRNRDLTQDSTVPKLKTELKKAFMILTKK